MRRTLLYAAVLLLSVLSLPSIQGQTLPVWSHFMRIDCDGTFEILPSAAFAVKLPIFRNIYNEVLQTFLGRAQCLCPQATREEFDLLFDPLTAMFNNIRAQPNSWNTCLRENLPRNLDQLTLIRFDLPNTCTLETWTSQGTCGMRHSFPRVKVDLQLALSKCPNSFFPSVSVSCAGDGCSTLGRPCASDANCNGLSCFDLESYLGIGPDEIPDGVFSAFKEALIYDENDVSPGCYQAGRGDGVKTPANDVLTYGLSFLARNFFSATNDYNRLQFCGILEVVNFTSTNDGDFLNQTALAGASASIDVVPSPLSSCLAPERSRASEFEDSFSQASGGDGVIDWLDGALLVDIQCMPNQMPPPNLCHLGQNSGSSNNCYNHQILDALYDSPSYPFSCFPNCNADLSSVVVTQQDIKDFLDKARDFAESYYQRPNYYQVGMSFTNGPFGSFLNNFLSTGEARSYQYPNAFSTRMNSFLKIYSWVSDGNGLASQSSRDLAAQYFRFFNSYHSQIINFVTSPSNCLNSAPVASYVSTYTANLDDFYFPFDSNEDDSLNSNEGTGLYQVSPDSIQGIYAAYYTQNYINLNSPKSISELVSEMKTFIGVFFILADLDQDGIVTIEEIYTNHFDSYYPFIDYFVSVDAWPLDVSRETFVEGLKTQTKALFDLNAPSGFYMKGWERNTTGVPQVSVSLYNLLTDNIVLYETPFSTLNSELYEDVVNTVFSPNIDLDGGKNLTFNEASSLFSDSKSDSLTFISRLILSEIFTSKVHPDMSWQDFTHSDSFDKLDYFNQTTRLRITVPGLKPWNGIESSGTSAFTRARVIPTFSKIPQRTVLVQFTCEQNLIFESHNFGLLLSQRLQKVFPQATSLLKELIACRSTPDDDDMARFLVRYGVWAPLLWLHVLDENSASFPLPEDQQDWVRSFFGEDQLGNIRVKGLPSTCNFYHFLETGSCEIDFLGLKTLLLADITIRISLTSCGSSSAFSSFTIECLGADCGLLTGLNPCDRDSQCSSGLTCLSLPKIITHLANKITSPPESDEYIDNLVFNETLLTDMALKTDFFSLFFSSEYNGNLCSQPSIFGSDPSDFFGQSPQEQCFGPSQWSADLQRILVNILGAETPNTNIQSKLHFCMPDLTVFDPQAISNWATTLVVTDGPTVTLNPNLFKAVSSSTPTPPSGLPTCRCSSTCGSLASACSKCYQAGGMVLASAPSACFCPSSGGSLPSALLNSWDVTMEPLCSSPLPSCSNCTACSSSCATCFGTSSSQCLSCANPTYVLVTKTDPDTNLISSSRCLAPCGGDQYRNQDGNCVSPDCSSLDDCSGQGTCFHSEFTQVDHCRCAAGYYGADCSEEPDCGAFSDCYGNGRCIYNQHFRGPRCQCNPGYISDNCSIPIISFSPNYDTELGGREIVVVHPDGFSDTDEIECRFGSTVVSGVANDDGSASCIAPPTAVVRRPVVTSVRKNEGAWEDSESPFFYYASETLVPRALSQLKKLEWPTGTTKTISWDASDACFGSTVNVYLIPWVVSQAEGTVTLGSKEFLDSYDNSDSPIDLSLDRAFSLSSPLAILSVEGARCSSNRYVIPVDATSPNYTAMCQSWVAAEAPLARPWASNLPGCPPNGFIRDPAFETYPFCSRDSKSCFSNLGASECRFSSVPQIPNYGGQTCCYNQNGDLLTNRATGGGNAIRYGVGSNWEQRLIAHFVGDILPGLHCCRLSDSCSLFSTVRPTSTGNAWIPPRTGGASGDPHLVTLDGKFWTFNGLGEYVLLERTDASNFVLQGRFSLAPSLNANAANATVLSGFAVQDATNIVSGYLGELEGLILFINGVELPALSAGSSFQSTNGEVVIFAQTGKYVITLPSGVNLEVSAEVSMISLVTLLPAGFKGKTRGLLGTWDQNKNNDFTLRSGSVVLSTSSQETLFSSFGQTYATTSVTSLFTYPDGYSFEDYNDVNFVPSFVTPAFPSEQARDLALAACAQAPSVDACLFDVAQTGDLRVANVALKAGAVFQTFSSAANTPPTFTSPPTSVNVRLGQVVTVQYAVTDAENQEVSLNLLTSPEGGALNQLAFTFTVSNAMFIGKSVVPLKVLAVDEGGSLSDPVTTNFTVVYSTCDDGETSILTEAALDLAAYCLATGCSADCAEIVSHVATLDASCKKQVIAQLGESFTAAREKCCAEVQTISCSDKATSGLSTGAIIGIAVGASVGGLLLIGLIAFFVVKNLHGKGKTDENEMKERSKH